jgi:hypothetical protein
MNPQLRSGQAVKPLTAQDKKLSSRTKISAANCKRVIVITCRGSVSRAIRKGGILKKFESVWAIGYQV